MTTAIAWAVAVVVASPAVYLLIRASEGSGAWTVLADTRTIGLIARTLLLALTVTVGALIVGVPLAYWTTRCRLPGRGVLVVLLSLPLAIPSYLLALTAIAFAGPGGVFASLVGIRLPVASGFGAATAVLIISTYPLVFLTTRSALKRLDVSMIEASRTLGVSHQQTFRRLILPSIRPAALAGGILVALYVIHDFGAVTLLRFDTFTRSIFVAYQGSFDRQRAAALGVMLLVIALTVAVLGANVRGASVGGRLHSSAPRPAEPVELGTLPRAGALTACWMIVASGVLLPVGVLVYLMARSARGVDLAAAFRGTGSSLLVAAVSTVVIVTAAVPVARTLSAARRRTAIALESLASVGYALPGLVVALSLVFFATRVALGIYQTMPLLVLAYLILFLPQATAGVRASVDQLPPALPEASRTLGAGPVRTLRRVDLPLMKPGLLAGAGLVMLTILKELPATIILSPPGFRSLAMRVYDESIAARYDQAALPALLILAISSIPLAGLLLRERGAKL
ncbi:MAG: ABC transporter permease [Actinomycetota bacterium]